MKVFKYEIIHAKFTLELPEFTEILTIQMQQSKPFIWALVKPQAPLVKRTFVVIATGEDLPVLDDGIYIYVGTFQQADIFVWHVFEVIR